MKKNIPVSYKGTIEGLESKLNSEDKKIIVDYVRHRRTKAGDEKVSAYKRILVILRDLAEVPFSKFNNKELIDNLLILIKNSNRERAGKNELKKVLKHFLKWKFQDLSLIEDIKLEKDFNERRFNAGTLPSPENLNKMAKACKNLKEMAMFSLQSELALRPHELLNLKWKNFKFFDEHGEVEVYANKTTHVRILPFKNCLIHILRWKKEFEFDNRTEDDWVFPFHNNRTKTLHKQFLGHLYNNLCKRAGIKTITPYMIRHAVLSSIYKQTTDARITAKFGGHSLKTSEIYVNLNDKDIKDIILDKIYNVKEPDVETRHKLEREVETLKKQRLEDNKILNALIKQVSKIKN